MQLDLFNHSPAEPLAAQAEAERRAWQAKQETVVVGTVADEKRRTASHSEQILALLKQGSVTNFDLKEICIRYSARIHKLRKQGHQIETVFTNKKSGLVVYRLKEGT